MSRIVDRGITYVPRYIRAASDLNYGEIVTHEHYNEMLNLNGSQGDYNTEILNLLLTVADPARVPHVPYLDEAINGAYDAIEEMQEDVRTALENSEEALELATTASEDVLAILNGTKKAGHAIQADKIVGIDSVGAYRYYGTNNEGVAGFHGFPDFIYGEDTTVGDSVVDGVFFVPGANSVNESMLTEGVRTKLNRVGITSYEELSNLPRIMGVELKGNMTLADLGIQPAGNYLTSIPAEYIVESELTTALTPYALATDVSGTYATKTSVTELDNTVNTNRTYAEGRYARICVGTFTGTPKNGDMLVTL